MLTDTEREQLQAWSRRPTSMWGTSREMVGSRFNRFAADRLEGLLDEPCPRRPRTIADAGVERVITTA